MASHIPSGIRHSGDTAPGPSCGMRTPPDRSAPRSAAGASDAVGLHRDGGLER